MKREDMITGVKLTLLFIIAVSAGIMVLQLNEISKNQIVCITDDGKVVCGYKYESGI